MTFHYTYETVLGSVTFIEEDGALLSISMQATDRGIEQETPLIKDALLQLSEYLRGERKKFDIPFRMRGTEFQIQVWKVLQNTPQPSQNT